MDRRKFLKAAGVGLAATGLAACGGNAAELSEEVSNDTLLPELNWEIATSWPLSLDTIFGGAEIFAARVGAMTAGRFTITPRAAGELAGGTEVLGVVEDGSVDMGHTASYYYTGRSPATAFGTALPFGLTARQQNAWLYEGGGLELMQDFYADRFNMIQFPAGNTGVQMGGWYNKEINSAADLEGLKMRIPGLGGEVMSRLGATVQVLPGGEIYQALETGAIDATEWVGPYDDQKMGFHQVSRFYYYPGWWEPGPTLEVQFNLDRWNELPEVYQEIVKTAAYQANMQMLARYDAKNIEALATLQSEAEIELRPFSDDVLTTAREASFSLYDEFAQQDPDFATIYQEWNAFRQGIEGWHGFNEARYAEYLASIQS
ncbi:MAG: substrate-binding domain-containing protein [Chloroflexota bacterium]